jgi:hypothetical protein
VYAQPVFSLFEGAVMHRRAGKRIPLLLQFGSRVVYVALITLVACLIPFFGSLMGLIGGRRASVCACVRVWPLTGLGRQGALQHLAHREGG